MFVVFDLDGTLALDEHRSHHIRGEQKDYDAFYAACVHDEPNWPAIRTFHAHMFLGHRVEIWSGRSDKVRPETLRWLEGAFSLVTCLEPERYLARMRPAGDHRPDVDLKRQWLRAARANGGGPDLVYDDRDRVVAMWREEGVSCFQVAPGQF
jgi:hypothetical protein